MQWSELIATLLDGSDLTHSQAYGLMDQVMSGELGEVRLASALTALRIKGVSVNEVHGFADAMREHAVIVDLPADSLDIVGTGGDGQRTVNISTMAAVVLAATGVPVVKHGNRASTSASGSADVLEALGVNLSLDDRGIIQTFNSVGIAFLFANNVHPSMRFAAPVRRHLAFPTVFNLLGPLTNPARPRAGAFGAAHRENAQLLAGVCAKRGISALVFRGKNKGLDELSTTDVNELWHVHDGVVDTLELDAVSTFGLTPCSIEDLRGGDAHENAQVARDVFAGRGAAPITEAVALNVAAGLVAYGHGDGVAPADGDVVARLSNGLSIALDALHSGAAADLLERWIQASHTPLN
ncbi:anthranilate phosphoribosyltransferase [Schaalia suimastitidis]|uniref:anthranilate phosphoribosyltransferase n=1 Tax=Schaalia suimastitidis TaxID=121163 RepID=UPI0003FFA74C|nr:anthranilate phosphoribosyltransferase [Schaalia suimastitidis]